MTTLLLIALGACRAPLADLQREAPPAVLAALPVCLEVAVKARAAGVRPALAARLAYRESRFRRDVVSSAGAVGPLQVLPWYWCKSLKPHSFSMESSDFRQLRRMSRNYPITHGNCDLVAAGILALRHYLRRAQGNERLAVCWYSGRRACT